MVIQITGNHIIEDGNEFENWQKKRETVAIW
jgi:hypothetical protein